MDELVEFAARLIGGVLGGLVEAFGQAAGNVRWPRVRKVRPVRRIWRRLGCRLFGHGGPLDTVVGAVCCRRCSALLKGPHWREVGR